MRACMSFGLALCLGAVACSHDTGARPEQDLATTGALPDLTAPPPPGADLKVPPPPPDLLPPPAPKEVVVYVRTGSGLTDGSDSNYSVCLNDGYCQALQSSAYTALAQGQVDEFRYNAATLPNKAAVDQIRLQWDNGTNAWRPTCLAVLLDGELLYCDDSLGISLGNGGGDVESYSAPDPSLKKCASCWGGTITHGPMIGHTTTTTSKIWFRGASSAPVTIELATNANLTGSVTVGPVAPSPETDYMAVLEATDLIPDTRYYYRLLVDGKPASATQPPYPSFLTAPGAAGKFTIAAGSCAKYEDQPIWDSIEALNPTLTLMMGDNHYGNTNDLGAHRFYYRNARSKPGVVKLYRKSSVLATWDDHDFLGNNQGGNAPGKDVALRAFKEEWANPSYGGATAPGVWHHAEWGGVDIIMLDDRYYRGVDGMLGEDQRIWLRETLKSSTAAFKLIVSGSQWTEYGSNESWASFDSEREELLQFLFDNDIGGVLLLSGDIHRSEVRRLVDAAPGKYPIYELTSSAFSQLVTPCVIGLGSRLTCYDSKNSFGLYTIDTTVTDPTLKFEIRDIDGDVQYTLDLKLSDLQVQ